MKNFKINDMLKIASKASGGDTDIIRTNEETIAIENQIELERQQQLQLQMEKMQSESNRNNAGASNLNNMAGFNGGMQ